MSVLLPAPVAAATRSETSKNAGPTSHVGTVDYLRFLSVAMVVSYHAETPFHDVMLSGMHALLGAAVYFAARSSRSTSITSTIRGRAKRILVPWCVFALIHLLLATLSRELQPWMWLTGGSLHLWFLPFIFVVTCLVRIATIQNRLRTSIVFATLWAGIGIAILGLEAHFSARLIDTKPIWQYLNGMPSAFFGLAIAAIPDGLSNRLKLSFIIALNVLGLCVWTTARNGEVMPYPASLIGISLFQIALLIPLPTTKTGIALGRISLGIYLIHILVLHGFQKLFASSYPSQFSDVERFLFAAVTTAASAIIVWLLVRTPFRQFIV